MTARGGPAWLMLLLWLLTMAAPGLMEECGPEEFQCDDGTKCIPARWLCDFSLDCLDGSDESSCPPASSDPPSCSPGEVACADGSCLPLSKHCDGHRDCPDNSDEGTFCEDTDCDLRGCSHHCRQTRQGPLCFCPPGENCPRCQPPSLCHIQDNYFLHPRSGAVWRSPSAGLVVSVTSCVKVVSAPVSPAISSYLRLSVAPSMSLPTSRQLSCLRTQRVSNTST